MAHIVQKHTSSHSGDSDRTNAVQTSDQIHISTPNTASAISF